MAPSIEILEYDETIDVDALHSWSAPNVATSPLDPSDLDGRQSASKLGSCTLGRFDADRTNAPYSRTSSNFTTSLSVCGNLATQIRRVEQKFDKKLNYILALLGDKPQRHHDHADVADSNICNDYTSGIPVLQLRNRAEHHKPAASGSLPADSQSLSNNIEFEEEVEELGEKDLLDDCSYTEERQPPPGVESLIQEVL